MNGYGWSYRWRLSRAAEAGMALVAVAATAVGPAAGSAAADPAAPVDAGSAWLDSESGDDDIKESEKASRRPAYGRPAKTPARSSTSRGSMVRTTPGASPTQAAGRSPARA